MAKLIQTPPMETPPAVKRTAKPAAEPGEAGSAEASKQLQAAREPAATRTLARIAQVDKLLKDTEE